MEKKKERGRKERRAIQVGNGLIFGAILAGYGCGMGLSGAISVAVALIARTVFQVVF